MLATLVLQFKCFHFEKTLVMLRKYLLILQKALPVELKLFNMDCLKIIPITEKEYIFNLLRTLQKVGVNLSCKLH